MTVYDYFPQNRGQQSYVSHSIANQTSFNIDPVPNRWKLTQNAVSSLVVRNRLYRCCIPGSDSNDFRFQHASRWNKLICYILN